MDFASNVNQFALRVGKSKSPHSYEYLFAGWLIYGLRQSTINDYKCLEIPCCRLAEVRKWEGFHWFLSFSIRYSEKHIDTVSENIFGLLRHLTVDQ